MDMGFNAGVLFWLHSTTVRVLCLILINGAWLISPGPVMLGMTVWRRSGPPDPEPAVLVARIAALLVAPSDRIKLFERIIVLLKVYNVIYPKAQIKKDQNVFEEFLIIHTIKLSGLTRLLKIPKENEKVSVRRRRSSQLVKISTAALRNLLNPLHNHVHQLLRESSLFLDLIFWVQHISNE